MLDYTAGFKKYIGVITHCSIYYIKLEFINNISNERASHSCAVNVSSLSLQ